MLYTTNVQTGIRDYFNEIKGIRIAQASPGFQEDVQNWQYSASNTRKHQPAAVAAKIRSPRCTVGQRREKSQPISDQNVGSPVNWMPVIRVLQERELSLPEGFSLRRSPVS